MKKEHDKNCVNIVLVGNPNTGKTTFFNTLTSSDEHVGNWHGVTVDYKEKVVKLGGEIFKVTDLPGLYSLSSYSYEEQVARDYIYSQLSNKNSVFISLCDANNLTRNLYLTIQLLELGITPILCINMANEMDKQGKKINAEKLSNMLQIPVVMINAQKRMDVEKIIKKVQKIKKNEQKSAKNSNFFKIFDCLCLNNIQNIIAKNLKNLSYLPANYVALKVLEKDEFVLSNLSLSLEQTKQIEQISSKFKFSSEMLVAKCRYDYISSITKSCVFKTKTKVYGYCKLDKIVLNKFFALPLFLVIVSLIFFLTFSSLGKLLTDILSSFIESHIFEPILNFVGKKVSNQFVLSLISDGIFAGVGSLISFLPQITLLFLSLSILEDTGYMSRLAFTLEDYFSKIGLTGKSVFALLMGFGCSTTSAMTSRNLEDKNSKIKTAMLAPYLSCTAKIPLYTVILSAFFLKLQLIFIILLYFLSVLVAVLVSFVLEKTILKSGEQSFIMELPPYRMPSLARIFKTLFSSIKSFILRVGTMIVSFSIIIWILESCDYMLRYNPQQSILKTIGSFLSPLFAPLGFNSWGAVVCLICGVVAKEVIVGTMGIINQVADLSLIGQSIASQSANFSLTPASALSFLVFSLLYMPCISTISVMNKEIGTKWTLIAISIQFSIAYILSFATYRLVQSVLINGWLETIISALIFAMIVTAFLIFQKFLNSKNKCKFCMSYKNCNLKQNKLCK